MQEAESSPRRGRRRSKQADQAILMATREVLLEAGYMGFTVNAVVERSGVSTATIYRRWETANELILAAIRSLVPEAIAIDSGRFEEDLSRFIDYLAQALLSVKEYTRVDKQDSRIDPALRRAIADMFIEPRMELLAEIVERAQQRGELKTLPAVEHCWSYVAGPLHHHLIISSKPYTAAYAAEIKAVIGATLAVLATR